MVKILKKMAKIFEKIAKWKFSTSLENSTEIYREQLIPLTSILLEL